MSQLYKVEKDVSVPASLLLKRAESGGYHLEGHALAKARSALTVTRRLLFEHQESDAYHPEEQGWTASPPSADGIHSIPSAESQASEAAEQSEVVLPVSPENTVPASSGNAEPAEAAIEPARLTRVQFRQALIEVDDPDDFWKGVVGGQVAALEAEAPLTGARVFAAFEDAVSDLAFSETWLAGYLLGLSDGWLRRRKLYPPAYTAMVKSLKKRRKR